MSVSRKSLNSDKQTISFLFLFFVFFCFFFVFFLFFDKK